MSPVQKISLFKRDIFAGVTFLRFCPFKNVTGAKKISRAFKSQHLARTKPSEATLMWLYGARVKISTCKNVTNGKLSRR